jgi:hydroxypyruvate isomerase
MRVGYSEYRVKFSLNLSMLFQEVPFPLRFAEAVKSGFPAVEFWFPYHYGGTDLIPFIQESGAKVVLFNLDPGDTSRGDWGTLGVPGMETNYKKAFEQALRMAELLGCTRLNGLAGMKPQDFEREECYDTLLNNLAWTVGQLPSGVTFLIEALNPFDKPGYLLSTPEDTFTLVQQFNHPAVRVQYDIYHAYRVGHDIFSTLRKDMDWIGHIQIADSPGRHQPGTGEIEFDPIFSQIQRAGYSGYIGLEYVPLGDTRNSLEWSNKWIN